MQGDYREKLTEQQV